MVPSASEAQSGTRSLKLYFVHTREKAEITFKRNGRYDSKGLQQLNRFLRDWRRNEPTKMDPRLFDLVWEVYQKSGSRDYIHVVSAYRSPATNSMLRSRSKGVAKKSQHMLGKAMDFYLPDVKLKNLREIGMKFQVGGVGYYPTSGSPFVHMDVGSVRAWPRMNRQELVRLFPDGKTMHLPSDGKPLPGYEQAVADYKRRVGDSSVQVAGGGSKDQANPKRKTFFAALFGGGGDEDEEPTAIASAEPLGEESTPVKASASASAGTIMNAADPGADAESQPVAEPVQTEVAINAPVPAIRPAFKDNSAAATELALVAPTASGAAEALDAALPQAAEPTSEYADLNGYKIPVPVLLGKREEAAATLTAAAEIEDSEELGFVPVPGFRPASEVALMAAANADVASPVSADRTGLAALAGTDQPDALAAEATAKVALADPATNRSRPVEMAALVSEDTGRSRSLAGIDAFDGTASEEVPVKGARPKKKDATAAMRGAIRTEPKLTQNVISKWALTQGRVEMLSKPVKAPRFVSKSLREAPTTVYLAGFQNTPTSVDPGRFSGTAVNFMEVRKFSDVN
ncbi:DUF882 domain-containing protein [Sinorhizobium sp. BG8]|uniref:DUF882 domain-containing protein n=1 Tax=Sinorhizobium sp. BG8 TaxID=2613773 RepID=UPI001AF82E0F|nr:DUF882 domain-containing protein [Sinorhizobium sp. BG8]QRM57022.1 DUF882 domain-containing protein [Sinorhizobium sp. BG8]